MFGRATITLGIGPHSSFRSASDTNVLMSVCRGCCILVITNMSLRYLREHVSIISAAITKIDTIKNF